MNKKIVSKMVVIILLLIITLTNFCYAINVTNSNLKKSIEKLFASDVKIETVTKTDNGSGTSTTTYEAPEELNVTESQIIMKESDDGHEIVFKINYSIEDKVAKFDMSMSPSEIGLEDEEELALGLLGLLLVQSESMTMSFLSTAEACGIDLELANSYYNQVISSQEMGNTDENGITTQTIEDDIIKYVLKYSEDDLTIQSSIEIQLDKLAELDSTDLNGTVTSTITFLNQSSNNNSNNTIENNTNQNKTVNNTSNTAKNNTSTNNNIVDNTVANKIIPAAGIEKASCIILVIVTIGLLIYVKIKQYDDVK